MDRPEIFAWTLLEKTKKRSGHRSLTKQDSSGRHPDGRPSLHAHNVRMILKEIAAD
jgi:Na+-transporting NADH:ubiquinone oxidoreductase subunit NqrA